MWLAPMTSPANTEPSLGERLREAREALGWTLVDLSEETGIPLRSLSRWENGGARPNGKSAVDLIKAYLKLDPDVAHALAAAMDIPLDPHIGRPVAAPAPPAAPPPPVAPPPSIDTFDAATLLTADALGLPPARLRAALVKLVLLWRAGGLTLDEVQRRLNAAERDGG
jgi:transcriptional regulator with XRE-family HTH domain